MMEQEIKPDPAIAAALRWIDGEPPMAEVDWTALRSAVRSSAELPLARRRARSTRVRRWTGALIPLAAAASVALTLWIGSGALDGSGTIAEGEPTVPARAMSAEEVFRSDLSEQEFRLLVSGNAHPDALLMIALDGS